MDGIAAIDLPVTRRGSAQLPLLGLTILLVEDSRYCSEAVRLLCLKSGARLRRADTLAAAFRHVATYRPSLVLVDIGLPDGSGLDLVRTLVSHRSGAPVILVTSGEDRALAAPAAYKAGADGFIPKPLKNIAEFQRSILEHFPDRPDYQGAKIVPLVPEVAPDLLAVSEDIRHACALLSSAAREMDQSKLIYCAQFLQSVAEASRDEQLAEIAAKIARSVGAKAGRKQCEKLAVALSRHSAIELVI